MVGRLATFGSQKQSIRIDVGGKSRERNASMRIVIDASVWVASQILTDINYSDADQLLNICLDQKAGIVVPEIVLLEVAAAVARLTRNPGAGQIAAKKIERFPRISFNRLDDKSLHRALMLATRSYLRAADALYVAAARSAKAALVTLDDEMLERGASAAKVMAVSAWLKEATSRG